VSIANPSIDSPLPYYRGKALVEQALAAVGVSYAIVRPTFFFGGGRDILANNIAWILRRMPQFVVPGDGRDLVQPTHVDDLARICLQAAHGRSDVIMDAAGPDTMSFEELVRAIRGAVGRRTPILHAPPAAMAALARALGLVLRDVVLTADEIRGLTAGLLALASSRARTHLLHRMAQRARINARRHARKTSWTATSFAEQAHSDSGGCPLTV
jgi:nucleoside-diphosphate-sugar epimerase